MNPHIPSIPARYYLRLLPLLLEREMDLTELFQLLGTDLSSYVQQEDAKLSLAQIETLVSYLLKFPENRDLAFELGRSLKLNAHYLVGYALLSCENVMQALGVMSQYFSLIMPNFRLKVTELTNVVVLDIHPLQAMSTLTLNFHLEAIAVGFCSSFAELLNQNVKPYDIHLSVFQPTYVQALQQLKPAQFHFGTLIRPSIKIFIQADNLETKLPKADAFSLNILEQQCREQLKQISLDGEIIDWISMMLREASPPPSFEDCAQMLNVSSKTLQRYLKKQDANFNTIRKQVILSRAKHLLMHTNKSITEISFELGYSTAANFCRTFKAELGTTPQMYRLNSMPKIS